jgi:methyl-accepting chemotaxis protein
MDQVTQQNAALVEQVAAAAGSLEGQAQRLQDAVSVFHVAEQQRSSVPPTPAKRAEPVLGARPAPVKRSPPPVLKTVAATKTRAVAGKPASVKVQQTPWKAPAVKLAASNADDWETF